MSTQPKALKTITTFAGLRRSMRGIERAVRYSCPLLEIRCAKGQVHYVALGAAGPMSYRDLLWYHTQDARPASGSMIEVYAFVQAVLTQMGPNAHAMVHAHATLAEQYLEIRRLNRRAKKDSAAERRERKTLARLQKKVAELQAKMGTVAQA